MERPERRAAGGRGFALAPAARALARRDPRLSRAAALLGWPELPASWTRETTLFDGLVRAVLAQQLSGHAARAIEARLLALAGEPFAPEAILALTPEALRAAGLSAAKARSLRTLAEAARSGELPGLAEAERLADEELERRLCAFRGVGPWTVRMLLLFTLGRPDVFAPSDLGLRRGRAYLEGSRELPDPATLERESQRWRPFRSLASLLLWRLAAYGPLPRQHQCQGS